MDRKKTKAGAILLLLGIAMTGNAQSYVTYNHDSSKKNQITVMEIGSGSLSPELYYQLLHSSYKKSAASKNTRLLCHGLYFSGVSHGKDRASSL